jgi:hypothetical protein
MPWEETLARRVANYLTFHAPTSPQRWGFEERLAPPDPVSLAEEFAYDEAFPPTGIQTIEQFEELVASHQRNQASVPIQLEFSALVNFPARLSLLDLLSLFKHLIRLQLSPHQSLSPAVAIPLAKPPSASVLW